VQELAALSAEQQEQHEGRGGWFDTPRGIHRATGSTPLAQDAFTGEEDPPGEGLGTQNRADHGLDDSGPRELSASPPAVPRLDFSRLALAETPGDAGEAGDAQEPADPPAHPPPRLPAPACAPAWRDSPRVGSSQDASSLLRGPAGAPYAEQVGAAAPGAGNVGTRAGQPAVERYADSPRGRMFAEKKRGWDWDKSSGAPRAGGGSGGASPTRQLDASADGLRLLAESLEAYIPPPAPARAPRREPARGLSGGRGCSTRALLHDSRSLLHDEQRPPHSDSAGDSAVDQQPLASHHNRGSSAHPAALSHRPAAHPSATAGRGGGANAPAYFAAALVAQMRDVLQVCPG